MTYPLNRPLLSVSTIDSILNREQADNFRKSLDEYCDELPVGRKLSFASL